MITRTLEAFEVVSENLESNSNNPNKYNIENFKIIAPIIERKKIEDIYFKKPYLQYPFRYLGNLHVFKSYIENETRSKFESYKRRKQLLIDMNGKTIQWKRKDLENFRLLIVNDEEVILTILGSHNSDEKIGIFTKEPYLVECFISLFDKIWEK